MILAESCSNKRQFSKSEFLAEDAIFVRNMVDHESWSIGIPIQLQLLTIDATVTIDTSDLKSLKLLKLFKRPLLSERPIAAYQYVNNEILADVL